jgi:TolB protein
MKKHFLQFIALIVLTINAWVVHAQLKIEITGVGSDQIPIAVAGFADDLPGDQSISAIVRADLARSGLFRIIDANEVIADSATVDMTTWKARGADAVVTGSVIRGADGRIEVRYKLRDASKSSIVSQLDIKVSAQQSRRAAHEAADDVLTALTGVRGMFNTRIAYVAKSGGEFRLEVTDADGENLFVPYKSTEPIISPAWSPDGKKLAYVSFESKKPVIYVQELETRRRIPVANYKGNNSAPAWSPDGKKIAVALSRESLTQIYLISADGSEIKRLTKSNGIDTEPVFSPDGQTIYFTSDRSGSPQIYRMSVDGSDVRRITFRSDYSISPSVSPDGKLLAYISGRGKGYQLYLHDLSSGSERALSTASQDESPSFAPNSRYIVFSSNAGGRGSLSVVSTDGNTRYQLTTRASNIREPAWGPFTK